MKFKHFYNMNLGWNLTTQITLIIQYRHSTRNRILSCADAIEFYGDHKVTAFQGNHVVLEGGRYL